MSASASKRARGLKEGRMDRAYRVRPTGNDSKRGSFDALVAEIEHEQRERGEEPALSSAAFRAGALIRMMRKSGGLSQAMLARRIGVTQARVSELEAGAGARGPSWDLMERVASACGATILVSPTESDIAIDAFAPADTDRKWTLAAAGG